MFHSVFTDYPLADIPATPSGWVETSWKNDACPSFQFVVDGETMRVFVDYADPDQRECPSVPRFGLTTEDGVPVFETDSWDALLAEAAKPRLSVGDDA